MKRIVILGAGESGAGAAVLAKKEGFDVFVSDMSAIKDKYKEMLDSHDIEWEEGHHTEEKILNADEIIKSPGIPDDDEEMYRKGHPHHQRNRVCRQIYQLEDDLHHRQQRQNHHHVTHLPHLQECRL